MLQASQMAVHGCQVDEAEVWTELGHAQLEAGSVAEAIASYLKSGHTGRYVDVIDRSKDRGAHAELVKFLLMVRKKIKEPKVCSFLPSTLSLVRSRGADTGVKLHVPMLYCWDEALHFGGASTAELHADLHCIL